MSESLIGTNWDDDSCCDDPRRYYAHLIFDLSVELIIARVAHMMHEFARYVYLKL